MISKKVVFTFITLLPVLFLWIGKKPANNIPVRTATVKTGKSASAGFCDGPNLGIYIADTAHYRLSPNFIFDSAVVLDMPAAGDQGDQSSCAAWATVYAAGNYYIHHTTGKPYSDTGNLSPKFVYNQISKGNCTCTSVLDNLYLLKTYGACSLQTMPYDANDCFTQPDSLQLTSASNYKIKGWKKINVHNRSLIKMALAENKPVIFAITTDDGFRKIASPYIWKEKSGGFEQAHSMVICGYDDNKKAFKVMNSWGTGWADGGFAWIDYEFFSSNVLNGGYIII